MVCGKMEVDNSKTKCKLLLQKHSYGYTVSGSDGLVTVEFWIAT